MHLDHLVFVVPDLDDAIAGFERHLGVSPRPGGRHPGLGTHNAILPLQDETYLELMAIDPDAPPASGPRPFGLDDLESARLATWAVRSRDIEADVAAARGRGFDPGVVIAMNREEPGGRTLRWHLSISRETSGDGLVPFVIDWGETPHPSLQSDRGVAGVRLTRLCAGHPDPDAIRQALHAMRVELDVVGSDSVWIDATLEGPAGRLELR